MQSAESPCRRSIQFTLSRRPFGANQLTPLLVVGCQRHGRHGNQRDSDATMSPPPRWRRKGRSARHRCGVLQEHPTRLSWQCVVDLSSPDGRRSDFGLTRQAYTYVHTYVCIRICTTYALTSLWARRYFVPSTAAVSSRRLCPAHQPPERSPSLCSAAGHFFPDLFVPAAAAEKGQRERRREGIATGAQDDD